MSPVKPSTAEETKKAEPESGGAVPAQEEQKEDRQSKEAAAADTNYHIYQVAPGETLYGICFQVYGLWTIWRRSARLMEWRVKTAFTLVRNF